MPPQITQRRQEHDLGHCGWLAYLSGSHRAAAHSFGALFGPPTQLSSPGLDFAPRRPFRQFPFLSLRIDECEARCASHSDLQQRNDRAIGASTSLTLQYRRSLLSARISQPLSRTLSTLPDPSAIRRLATSPAMVHLSLPHRRPHLLSSKQNAGAAGQVEPKSAQSRYLDSSASSLAGTDQKPLILKVYVIRVGCVSHVEVSMMVNAH